MSMQQMLSELTEVTPFLFISSATAITENKLKLLGINLIVNATKELLHFPTDDESIHRVRVPIYDNSEATLYPYFRPICDLIEANEKQGGKTLVHCLAGRSRSASLCIAYLILQKKAERLKAGPSATSVKSSWTIHSKDLYECLDDLKRLRPLVQPNSNFMRQLVKWEADVSKTDLEPYNPYDFFSYQMNKSERSHLEAIQNIEFVTCRIADSKNVDTNGNLAECLVENVVETLVESLTSKRCCSAFLNDLNACGKCNKVEVI